MPQRIAMSSSKYPPKTQKKQIDLLPIIGSDNGLAPTRRQAIIWTNDGKLTDAYMRHSASMS